MEAVEAERLKLQEVEAVEAERLKLQKAEGAVEAERLKLPKTVGANGQNGLIGIGPHGTNGVNGGEDLDTKTIGGQQVRNCHPRMNGIRSVEAERLKLVKKKTVISWIGIMGRQPSPSHKL